MRRANEWAALLGVDSRARFEVANATVSLASLLATYPGPLALVTIQAQARQAPCRGGRAIWGSQDP